MTLTTTGRHALKDALRRAVDRLDPVTRSQAGYHLCWTDADGRPDDSGGGKAVRPALELLSARAVGAPPDTGIPGAVAVELGLSTRGARRVPGSRICGAKNRRLCT